jgi:hypothetical protein
MQAPLGHAQRGFFIEGVRSIGKMVMRVIAAPFVMPAKAGIQFRLNR